MGEWPTVQLGSLASPKDGAIAIGPFGSAMKAETYTSTGVPVIRGTNISDTRAWKGDWVFIPDILADRMRRCVVTTDNLVFPHRGSIGEVGIVPKDQYERYFLSSSLMKIEIDERKANPLFVYYYFRSTDGRAEILRFSSQVGTPGIGQPLSSLKTFSLPLPQLVVQESIASLLGALDDKIDLNRLMNETLEMIARLFFKDWFVDFGPTRAKAEGRPPYLVPELWELFPNALDDDDKPVGWRFGQLQEIVEFNPSESLSREAVAPYLEMASLPTSGSIPEAAIPREFSSGMKFRNGDTLLARITPCLENGKTAFVQNLPHGTVGWGSTEFIVMRPIRPVPSPWGYILAREPSFRNHAIQSMTGTSGRQRARTEALEQYPVAIADTPVWQAFGSLIDPIFEQIRANGEESLALSQTRDLLLPKLMSGEIRLLDAEKLVEQVA